MRYESAGFRRVTAIRPVYLQYLLLQGVDVLWQARAPISDRGGWGIDGVSFDSDTSLYEGADDGLQQGELHSRET